MKLSRISSAWMKAIFVAGIALAGMERATAQRPLGIDVSTYQGSSDNPPTNVDWAAVANSGITFAWAKATEGLTVNDVDFGYNESNAVANGVLIGAYHFAHPELHKGAAGADAEAAHFWSIASNYLTGGGLYMMPVLDYETAPGSSYTKATSSQWVNEWCQDLANYGASNGVFINPIVYTYTSFANTWLDTTVTQWPLWMAAGLNGQTAQTGSPPTSPWTNWAFWQYGTSTVPGVERAVDSDVFHGSAADLGAYVIGGGNSVLTTTTLNAMNPSPYGKPVVFTATVDPAPSGGNVQFYTNGVVWGSPLDATGGEVAIFTSLLPAGMYSVSASYSGAVGYLPSSTDSPSIQEIDPASVTITPNPQSKMYGTSLTFGGSSTNFSSSGLKNGDTIGFVILTDTANGGAATAPVGTYPITPSLATNGTYNPSNYNIIYNNGALTVTLPSNSIPVTINNVALATNGGAQMNFTGTPGYVYWIEAATNLVPPIHWTIVGTNAADTNGLFTFTDFSATNFTDRFYRTMAQ